MKRFRGTYDRGDHRVDVVEDGPNPWSMKLPMRLDLANHSPTGFCWGYNGSGPAQLSLAILVEVLQHSGRALAIYQSFKARVIARFEQESDWELTEAQVFEWVQRLEAERGGPCDVTTEGRGHG